MSKSNKKGSLEKYANIAQIIIALVALISLFFSCSVLKTNEELVDSQLAYMDNQSRIINKQIDAFVAEAKYFEYQTNPDLYFIVKPVVWDMKIDEEYTVSKERFLQKNQEIILNIGNNGFKPLYIWSVYAYDDCLETPKNPFSIESMVIEPVKPGDNYVINATLWGKYTDFGNKRNCRLYFDVQTNQGIKTASFILQE